MSVVYNGVVLEDLDKEVGLINSVAMAAMGEDQNVNTVYLDKIFAYKRADLPSEQFDEINKLFSLVKMNYQICNGGIYQYFGNGYHNHYISEDRETELFDKDVQVDTLRNLCSFANAVFAECSVENSKLSRIVQVFDSLSFEENVPQYGMVYSDEEEQIWDEEEEEWVDNPDYEEPYEDALDYEDEVRSTLSGYNVDNFDEEYYDINDYLEKVIEAYAQYLSKSFDNQKGLVADVLRNASERAQRCEASNEVLEKESEK